MSKIAKVATGLMIITFLGKILGFCRELVLAAAYGANELTDIYLVAVNVPNVIFTSIAGALSIMFIPMFCEIKESKGNKAAVKYTNNIINIVVILAIILTILCLIFTEPLIKVLAAGFTGAKLEKAIVFTRILVLGTAFIGIRSISTSYLEVNGNFNVPGMIGIPYNLIIIISIFISLKFEFSVLVWATLIALIVQSLMLIPFMYKKGYKYSSYLNFNDSDIKKLIILIIPTFIGVAANEINMLVDRTLASTLENGILTSLNYANKLNGFILALVIAPITSVIYPTIANIVSSNDKSNLVLTIKTSINSMILILMPITFGAMTLSIPIVSLLFERGQFNSTTTLITSGALVFYSMGLVSIGIINVLYKVFYSTQNTKIPMINGVITVIINIILNLVLIKPMGHLGLALSTSISTSIGCIMLYKNLGKINISVDTKNIIITLIKSLISSIIMGILVSISHNYLIGVFEHSSMGSIISLIISISLGVLTYGLAIIVFKVDEISFMINRVRYKLDINRKVS